MCECGLPGDLGSNSEGGFLFFLHLITSINGDLAVGNSPLVTEETPLSPVGRCQFSRRTDASSSVGRFQGLPGKSLH